MASVGHDRHSFSFEEQYFEANYYDYEKQNPPYKEHQILRFLLQYAKPGGALLDIGCGWGNFLVAASQYFEVSGSEASKFALTKAASKLPQARLYYETWEPDLLPDSSFDVIVSLGVLEHLPELESKLAIIHRRLRSGGFLLADVPIYEGPFGKIVGILDRDSTHIHKHGPDFWLGVIGRRFQVVDYTGAYRYFLRPWKYICFTNYLTRRIAPNIIILAKKVAS